MKRSWALLLCLALALAACTSQAGTRSIPALARQKPARPSSSSGPGSYIKHVVLVIQENRSFDNIFTGFPGADYKWIGKKHDGTPVRLTKMTFNNGVKLSHGWQQGIADWDNGKMDGYDLEALSTNGQASGNLAYAFLARSLVAPYWAMAQQYALADRMFATEFGNSFTGHLMLISGNTNVATNEAEANAPFTAPWGCDAAQGSITTTVNASRVIAYNGPFPCFTQFHTMADTLDAKGVSWKFYTPSINESGGLWSAFSAISNVRYGADWANVISPPKTILTDIANGNLASMTWVTPEAPDSDHAGYQSDTGPSWVAAIVNAIGQSQYWNDTAVIVVWDDWGGWYDHVPPPQLDFRGLAQRVPCIIISPYAKHGYVSHTRYEFGSILRFVEDVFQLPWIGPPTEGYTDRRSRSIIDSFDFTQTPPPFQVIPAPYPSSHFLSERPALEPPDDE